MLTHLPVLHALHAVGFQSQRFVHVLIQAPKISLIMSIHCSHPQTFLHHRRCYYCRWRAIPRRHCSAACFAQSFVAAVPELSSGLCVFLRFFASGDHPQEEWTKFGYRSNNKVDFKKKIPAQFWRRIEETHCLNMATCNFFFFKKWRFSPFFRTRKKRSLSTTIRTGFHFGRQNAKITRGKKKKQKHCKSEHSLKFSPSRFFGSAIKGNIPLKILYFEYKKRIRIAKSRGGGGKKGEQFEFFLGHVSSAHSNFGLVAVLFCSFFLN